MPAFTTRMLPDAADAIAPDGSEVRVMAVTDAVSFSHFRLAAGTVAAAVRHRTVAETWYVIAGHGRLWRAASTAAEAGIVELAKGLCVTIPLGTAFQFRSDGPEALEIVCATAPPWPGDDEAVVLAAGAWAPTVSEAR